MTLAGAHELVFLKLGGSLITEKNRAHTARRDVIGRSAREIVAVRRENPGLHLLLGHGSGSFGHVAAHRYGTRHGVRTEEEWLGFVEVWKEAAALNHIVLEELLDAGLPAIALPASAAVIANNGQIVQWKTTAIRHALEVGLLPVIYGDVIFDEGRGGTILSTEDLFAYLAIELKPQRVLLAGLEPGVWVDYPVCSQLIQEITPKSYPEFALSIAGSAATDVTGGMASKVVQALELVQQLRSLEVLIFSGDQPGNIQRALADASPGTRIRSA